MLYTRSNTTLLFIKNSFLNSICCHYLYYIHWNSSYWESQILVRILIGDNSHNFLSQLIFLHLANVHCSYQTSFWEWGGLFKYQRAWPTFWINMHIWKLPSIWRGTQAEILSLWFPKKADYPCLFLKQFSINLKSFTPRVWSLHMWQDLHNS